MHNSKDCFKCGVHKPLSEFYKHKKMADGHLNKCKECTKKDTKENILKNHDYYREYDKNRANLPHRVQARSNYSQTPEGRIAAGRAKRKWCDSNLIKRSASVMVNNAIRDGKIIKRYSCEECAIDNVRICGHHDDYSQPLVVRWLCSKCHCDWHKKHGEGLNVSIT